MVGRFQVMALLQAARAKVLGYPLDEAQSFGLNRAIFSGRWCMQPICTIQRQADRTNSFVPHFG
jgi:hypothetical protein